MAPLRKNSQLKKSYELTILADIRYLVSECNNQNNEIFIEISHWFAKSGKTRAFCFKIASLGHALFFFQVADRQRRLAKDGSYFGIHVVKLSGST